MGHLHSVYDTDLHFIIDPISRQISSESGKVILMQNDHNSERFTFQIPRYVEGHDMSICDIAQVHYINTSSAADGGTTADVYIIDDLQVSPNSEEVVIGSWLISQNATRYSGTLTFIVRFACTVDTKVEYQWFSDMYTGVSISPGIFNIDSVTADWDNTDVLEKWRKEVFKMVEDDIAEATAEMNAALETIKELQVQVEEDAESANKSETNSALSANAAAESAHAAAISAAAAAQSAANAQTSEYNAKESANYSETFYKASRSYAVGDTNTRAGEETDNSKYYSELAQSVSTEALETLREADATLIELSEKLTETAFSINFNTGNLEYTSPSHTFTINTESGNLEWEVI